MLKHPHDIENDLEHTIPPEGGPSSRLLFRAMTERALALVAARPGERLVDLGCGMGQDALALASRLGSGQGASRGWVLAVEPSSRMIRFGQGLARAAPGAAPPVCFLRAFAEGLPLASGCVDGLLCKGALDHFIAPPLTLAEVARVLRPGGRAVFALANYDSLACRLGRAWDGLKRRVVPGFSPPDHPHYEPPPDHLTRFGYREIMALAAGPLRMRRVEGISLLWGFGPWERLLALLPAPWAEAAARAAAWPARIFPAWADVVIVQAMKDSPTPPIPHESRP
jgi:SAM-dependent methyltransferase